MILFDFYMLLKNAVIYFSNLDIVFISIAEPFSINYIAKSLYQDNFISFQAMGILLLFGMIASIMILIGIKIAPKNKEFKATSDVKMVKVKIGEGVDI